MPEELIHKEDTELSQEAVEKIWQEEGYELDETISKEEMIEQLKEDYETFLKENGVNVRDDMSLTDMVESKNILKEQLKPQEEAQDASDASATAEQPDVEMHEQPEKVESEREQSKESSAEIDALESKLKELKEMKHRKPYAEWKNYDYDQRLTEEQKEEMCAQGIYPGSDEYEQTATQYGVTTYSSQIKKAQFEIKELASALSEIEKRIANNKNLKIAYDHELKMIKKLGIKDYEEELTLPIKPYEESIQVKEEMTNLFKEYKSRGLKASEIKKEMADYISERLDSNKKNFDNLDREKNEKTAEIEKKKQEIRNLTLESLKRGKDSYNWDPQLTEEQISELWGQGIVPGSDEYDQALHERLGMSIDEKIKKTEEEIKAAKEKKTDKAVEKTPETKVETTSGPERQTALQNPPVLQPKNIHKVEDKKKWAKWVAGAAGLACGYGMSVVIAANPALNGAMMVYSTGKLLLTGTKYVASKLGVKEPMEPQFVTKIKSHIPESVKEKAAVIKNFMKKQEVQWFLNGVSIGYLAGSIHNAVKKGAGKPDSGKTEVTKDVNIENKGPVSPSEPIGMKSNLIEEGKTFDLSGIKEGYTSSYANQPVTLMTDAAKEVTLTQTRIAEDGTKWFHFAQANGKGMAWYTADQLKEAGFELAETVGRGR